MSGAHAFLIHDLSAFLVDLAARGYTKNTAHRESNGWIVYSKLKSGALIKSYSYSAAVPRTPVVTVRVTYELVQQGVPLMRLARELKSLNALYRDSLPGWKTKRPMAARVRHQRWARIQQFLRKHALLIGTFRYQSDDYLTEGNPSFNVHIATTPKEQSICIEFIKALVEAFRPEAIIRGHRQIDKPAIQRNGWIRRFAGIHRKRGWSAREIVARAQKELRDGTWNQRYKLQYNLAPNTISKIAGLKLPSLTSN